MKPAVRAAFWVGGIILLVLAVGIGWAAAVWWPQQLAPIDITARETVNVEIPRGASTHAVASLLYNKGLIHNELVFRLYARLEGMDGQLKAGEYRFGPHESVPAVLERLVQGDVITYSFTVPEGYRVEQIAELLVEQGLAAEARLWELLKNSSYIEAYFEGTETVRHPLEGFLFPDTYQVTREITEEEIIRMMVRRFEETFNEEWRERAAELGLSIYEVVVLASIVEKEAKLPEERPLIAAVYHNRLERGWRLQACPTVQYGLAEFDQLLFDDLEVDTPYNTYIYEGLPPGPIASPGRETLQAVLYPADVPYLYFVACSEAGGHAFAETNEEHNRNVFRCRDKSE